MIRSFRQPQSANGFGNIAERSLQRSVAGRGGGVVCAGRAVQQMRLDGRAGGKLDDPDGHALGLDRAAHQLEPLSLPLLIFPLAGVCRRKTPVQLIISIDIISVGENVQITIGHEDQVASNVESVLGLYVFGGKETGR